MSSGSRKGYMNIPAIDPKTGTHHVVIARVDSPVAKMYLSRKEKLDKQQRRAFREFKDQMRESKKAIPLEQRAKIRWSEVQVETTETTVFEPIDDSPRGGG